MTRLSASPTVHPSARLTRSSLGAWTEVGEGCRLLECTLGDYSYVMEDGDLYRAEIGRFTNIASRVRLNATNHPSERATQHHFTYRSADYFDGVEDDAAFFAARRARTVVLGHDVWIGHGVTVLPGVRIGHGAIVGAGAVLTRDVPPWCVADGVPARVRRRRVDVGERLEALAWWDWSHERLRDALEDFRTLDVEAFLERHESRRSAP